MPISASQGKFLLCRKTRRDRMRAKLQEIKEELRRRMHQPIPLQGPWLGRSCRHFAYYAVPTKARHSARSGITHRPLASNAAAAQPEGRLHVAPNHETGRRLASEAPHPSSLADERFAVKHPRWEPYARIGSYGSVRGALRMSVPTANVQPTPTSGTGIARPRFIA